MIWLTHGIADTVVGADELRFAQHGLDDPVTDDLIASCRHPRLVQNLRTHIVATPSRCATSPATAPLCCRASFCRTGQQVADQMADWFESGACDGFVLAATHLPGRSKTWCAWWSPSYSAAAVPYRIRSSTLRDTWLQRPSNSRVPAGAGV